MKCNCKRYWVGPWYEIDRATRKIVEHTGFWVGCRCENNKKEVSK